MASLALFGASATLLALLFLGLRYVERCQDELIKLGERQVIRVLTCCHWCLARDLVRVRTAEFCADCDRPVCARHAQPCAYCAHTTCVAFGGSAEDGDR
jgi:hypothetical protein